MTTSTLPQAPDHDPVRARANGLEIAYDTFGDPSAPPLLLIQGLGMQMIAWHESFCQALAGQGYRVIRFDNRDTGLSTRLDSLGVPDIPALIQARAQGETVHTPYSLDDMAADSVALLDALAIESAHVVGVSMGGMIAQLMAIRYPDRVRTLTSIMSSTGERGAPVPRPEALWVLVAPAPLERAAYLEHSLKVWQVLNGTEMPFDADQVRQISGRAFDRGLSPGGTARQLAAIVAGPSRKQALSAIAVPVLVIHGSADPLIPLEYGRDTAGAIPGAGLLIVDGLGHRLHPDAVPQIVEAIARHARG
jgi:pimeloyl-ACP methyl ester carboxylesterase